MSKSRKDQRAWDRKRLARKRVDAAGQQERVAAAAERRKASR